MSPARLFGMTTVALTAVVILLTNCNDAPPPPSERTSLDTGTLVFRLNDSVDVRIPGQWTGDTLILRNSEETLRLQPSTKGDNQWTVPVFDGLLSLQNDTGHWEDVLRPGAYRVPIQWEPAAAATPEPAWGGDTLSWTLTFGTDEPWLGQLFLQQEGSTCRGSIATATGDFRYLHGTLADSGNLRLQTFDGAHLFCFSAALDDAGHLHSGTFWSGNHYATSFTGTPVQAGKTAFDEAPTAIWTGLPVAYSGLGLDGDSIHWNAGAASGTHVLSVMGSWCPNCMDEHRLLAGLMAQHPQLRVHTLAFERGVDTNEGSQRALQRLSRYAEQMGLEKFGDRWHIVLAGPASKREAQTALPFLDRVVSFPTTVVTHDGDTPWIHSGFNGPAMGPAHDLEVTRFAAAISGSTGSR